MLDDAPGVELALEDAPNEVALSDCEPLDADGVIELDSGAEDDAADEAVALDERADDEAGSEVVGAELEAALDEVEVEVTLELVSLIKVLLNDDLVDDDRLVGELVVEVDVVVELEVLVVVVVAGSLQGGVRIDHKLHRLGLTWYER